MVRPGMRTLHVRYTALHRAARTRKQGLPYWITSNQYIARQYAEMLVHFAFQVAAV